MDRNKTLLILVAAWVSAGLLSWFVYANAIAPKTEPQTKVVVAAKDMPLGTLLKATDLKEVNIPERTLPKGAVTQIKDATGRVLLVSVNTNETVVAAKLSSQTTTEGMASIIPTGYRAVSVQITDVTGVAGLIQPNSRVDVLFTRPGNMDEASTSTILQNVRVLSTGRVQSASQSTAASAAADRSASKTPVVTLLLEPGDAQKLELAKNQGRISLSLRNPLDTAATADTAPITPEVLDPTFDQRAAAARKRRMPEKPVDEAAVWQRLAAMQKAETTKKEPEKPRLVVDVFRGDKHVQEQFK